jgi:hypothetical protein
MDVGAARFALPAQLTGKEYLMSARKITVVAFILIAFGSTASVSAGWLANFFCKNAQDLRDRHAWPSQYIYADRVVMQASFNAMTTNGWRRQNMLGEFHFEPKTGQLTEAGQVKVRWILTACPEEHRLVYVHIAATQEETLARVTSVRQWASQVAPNNGAPVLTTSISDDGWPADRVDMINRSIQKSMPAPRLPYLPNSNDSSSGGSSGK